MGQVVRANHLSQLMASTTATTATTATVMIPARGPQRGVLFILTIHFNLILNVNPIQSKSNLNLI